MEIFVLSTVWYHAMDSGEDETIVGAFKTFAEAAATGEAYKKANMCVSPIDGIARDNYQYQYRIRSIAVSDNSGEEFWKEERQRQEIIRRKQEAADQEYRARLKEWEALKPKRP